MNELQTKLPTDTWISGSWNEYLQTLVSPEFVKSKGYYFNGKIRVETMPVGSDHSRDHSLIMFAVSLLATIRGIPFSERDNCTYRKTNIQDSQPDVSYHFGDRADLIPWGTSIVDLDIYPPPDLVIEVSNTSLSDDKGDKRLLYEDLGVSEYWIVDVFNVQIFAFIMVDGGSRRTYQSHILPGLSISLLEEALQRSRQVNQAQVYAWLLSEFQAEFQAQS
jgi:Uma2 family endonuclease